MGHLHRPPQKERASPQSKAPTPRPLGRTGLWVNPLGFGAMHVWTEAEAPAVLQAAFATGINFVETGRAYGGSELVLGQALAGWDEVIVASKTMSRSRHGVLYDIDRGLRHLGRDHIHLYQLHDVGPEAWETVTSPQGALAGLREAQEQGKVDWVGISSHSLEVLEAAVASGHFDTIQLAYNPFSPQARRVAALAASRGVGVIAMKPFGGFGMLSTLRLAEPPSPLDASILLRYALSDPSVSVVIPGMRFGAEVAQNLATACQPLLTEGERAGVEDEAAAFLAIMSLGDGYCRGCGYCIHDQAEDGACPIGIDIPHILVNFYNPHRIPGEALARLRQRYYAYTATESGAEACADCGACEPSCPYHLPIAEMLQETYRQLEGGP